MLVSQQVGIERRSNRFLALGQVFDVSSSTGWYFVSHQLVGIECLSSRFLAKHLVLAHLQVCIQSEHPIPGLRPVICCKPINMLVYRVCAVDSWPGIW